MRFLLKTATAMVCAAAAVMLAAVSTSAQVNVPFTTCGGSGDHLTISSITATAWPPSSGSSLTLVIDGKVDENVTAGVYNAVVYFDGIDLYSTNGDLSSLTTLPTGPGAVSLKYAQDIPSIAPSGDYVVDVTANDQTNAELTCFKVSFSL